MHTDSIPDPQPDNETPALPPPRRRWRLLAALGLLLILLGGSATWLTTSERGFAALWRAASALSGGALSVGRVQGTLWQGFALDSVRLVTPASSTDIDHLAVDWVPSMLWRRTLHVRRIEVGTVRIKPNPAAPPAPPPSMPASLALPLAIRVDSLTVQAVTLSSGDFAVYDLDLGYGYDQASHRLQLRRARLPQGTLSAQVSLADRAPFVLRGAVDAQAEQGGGTLQLGGSLQSLHLQGHLRAAPVAVDLDADFSPFATQPFDRVQRLALHTRDVNPRDIAPALPLAALDLDVNIQPAGHAGARGTLQLQNRLSGPVSSGRVPLSTLRAVFSLNDSWLDIASLTLQLPAGTVSVQGRLDRHGSDLRARLDRVGLRALDVSAPDDVVQGQIGLKGPFAAPRLRLALQGRRLAADADLDLQHLPSGQWAMTLPRARLSAGSGRLDLSGVLDAKRTFTLRGHLTHANPRALLPQWPQGDINATLQADGSLITPIKASLKLAFASSRLSGAPLGGALQLQVAGSRLERVLADLDLAGNRLKAQGAWGAPGDHLQLALDAPALARIGFGLGGSLAGKLDLSGQPASPRLLADLRGQQLRLPGAVAVQSLSLNGDVRAGGNGRVQLQLAAQGASGAGWRADALQVRLDGTQARHALSADARLQLATQPYRLGLQLQGGWDAARATWRGSLQRLQLAGAPDLNLLAPMTLALGKDGLSLGAARLNVAGGLLTLDGLQRHADGRIVSRGRLDNLSLAALKPWVDLPLARTLALGATWDLRADGHGSLSVQKQRGDIVLDALPGGKALALDPARLRLDWGPSQTRFALDAGARRASVHAEGTLAALPWQLSANTPLAGRMRIEVPELAELAVATGMQGDTGGSLLADLRVSGPLTRPGAVGNINGHNLLWRDRKTGVRLSGGELSARLDGRSLLLDKLRFVSGEGSASASGRVDMLGAVPTADIRVDIRRFSVFDRPDRRLVVSGTAAFSLSDKRIALSGLVRADAGHLSLPKAGMPALSDDVVIVGRPVEQSSLASLPVQVDLTLDLGRRFTFEAPGLKVDLSGQVQVTAHQGSAPTARGVVKVLKGSYKAYGQELDIASGTITFVGPLDNPNLNIRAKRRLSTVGAGVEVTGSVSAPRLQLIADETLSERDKLAWLVLGHAADDNAQDNNFLALMASQMAAGRINDQLGLLDDVGLARKQSKTALNGTVSPAEQVLTVGKQLTRTFYLGYEYGLTSSQQALKVIYRLSRGWSLLLRVGANASAESRYTVRFD